MTISDVTHTNMLANANAVLADFSDVVRGHDAVHPSRNECGGLGGCLLMRAEHDAEQSLIDALLDLIRQGMRMTLRATDRTHEDPDPGMPAETDEALAADCQTGRRPDTTGFFTG